MADDPLIGRQFANYRIERLLGRGGMAIVYFGTDIVLRRPVAIKMIDARYRDQKGYAERFLQEARAVASWRHENIIQVYYAGEQDGLFYYVMEFIDGPDLAYLLDQFSRAGELVPQADVLHLGRALASALDYAHARGVVHRDVKPSNVFIERGGRIVLGDFGLAMDIQTGSLGEVFGTPQYMAPEQARVSNAAVSQSDIYSLAVILYEMLAGRVPFDDPSPSAVALQQLTLRVPPPSRFNPDLDAGVDAVLLKALGKEPGERYATGSALVEALQSALHASPPATRPLSDLSSDQPRAESQVSIFQRAKEAPPALAAAPDPGVLNDQRMANLRGPEARGRKELAQPASPPGIIFPKVMAGIGIGGCLALAVLCLLVLLQPSAILDRFQTLLPLAGYPTNAPGGTQAAPPEITIGSGPANSTTDTEAAFTFSANRPDSTFECALDAGVFQACTSPKLYTGLSVGEHTFEVRALDAAGDRVSSPASYAWTVAAAAPRVDCGAPVTVFAEADSWIDQNSSSNNFGSDSILKVQSKSGNNFHALIRFALPPVPEGCQVESATLRLYAASFRNGRTLQVLRVAETWTEMGVTWNNQPATTGAAATAASGSGYLEWSVGALVLAEYEANTNNGFLIRDAVENQDAEQQFHSREKGENVPQLVITFTPARP